jgi:glutathione peroxidase
MSLYSFEAKTIQGKPTTLEPYAGKVLLVVNTASECGFTGQYAGLDELHRKYKDRGFAVLAFPCNQFGNQEPGDDAKIAEFCDLRFKATFPLFAKIEVNGPGAHPLFEHLKEEAPGLLGTKAIKWNFTKFLVGRDGKVMKRFAPSTKPVELEGAIETALG